MNNGTKTIDPFEMWKNLYDQAETYWSKVLDENLATEDFSRGLGKVLDMNLQYKKLVNDSTKAYLQQMNMPSKEDLANLATMMINVEEKIDHIEEVVDGFLDIEMTQQKQMSEINTLKSEVKELHKKIDQIVDILQKP
ncbi:polyhydroxyalkanoic acid synthase subunit PhaR [Calidifontibacillus oryziterrae]|uniref:polyhydroxyalkanoic acid synthase subunit PhaR n=1 Tax=Calidifontibacillus oryziterrae TaxID=1191699 RepID=UPI0002E7658B|nr:polyhydroxyalkanoic acid synthase subunit PhaR [Calidifontibacillus oryziterrae]